MTKIIKNLEEHTTLYNLVDRSSFNLSSLKPAVKSFGWLVKHFWKNVLLNQTKLVWTIFFPHWYFWWRFLWYLMKVIVLTITTTNCTLWLSVTKSQSRFCRNEKLINTTIWPEKTPHHLLSLSLLGCNLSDWVGGMTFSAGEYDTAHSAANPWAWRGVLLGCLVFNS